MTDEHKALHELIKDLLQKFEADADEVIKERRDKGLPPLPNDRSTRIAAHRELMNLDISKGIRCCVCNFIMSPGFLDKMVESPGQYGRAYFDKDWKLELSCSRCIHMQHVQETLMGMKTASGKDGVTAGAVFIDKVDGTFCSRTPKDKGGVARSLTDPDAKPVVISSVMASGIELGLAVMVSKSNDIIGKTPKELMTDDTGHVFIQFVASLKDKEKDGVTPASGYLLPDGVELIKDQMALSGVVMTRRQFIVMVNDGLRMLLSEAGISGVKCLVELVCSAAHPDRDLLLHDSLELFFAEGPEGIQKLLNTANMVTSGEGQKMAQETLAVLEKKQGNESHESQEADEELLNLFKNVKGGDPTIH